MTADGLATFEESLEPFRDLINEFRSPSCQAFTRYLSIWEMGISKHFPLIHFPTLRLNSCLPELVLIMAALGASQILEEHTSLKLYQAAKTISLERLRLQDLHSRKQCLNKGAKDFQLLSPAGSMDSQNSSLVDVPELGMQSARTLLFLLIYASWGRDTNLVADSFEFHAPLLRHIRAEGLSERIHGPEDDWASWVATETQRRTALLAFCFLNIHTVAYNHNPVLLAGEVNLNLPCSTKEWEASTEYEWRLARQENPWEQPAFQTALKSILASDDADLSLQPLPYAFGNMILLHALIQRIFLMRQLATQLDLEDHETKKIQYVCPRRLLYTRIQQASRYVKRSLTTVWG